MVMGMPHKHSTSGRVMDQRPSRWAPNSMAVFVSWLCFRGTAPSQWESENSSRAKATPPPPNTHTDRKHRTPLLAYSGLRSLKWASRTFLTLQMLLPNHFSLSPSQGVKPMSWTSRLARLPGSSPFFSQTLPPRFFHSFFFTEHPGEMGGYRIFILHLGEETGNFY